MSAAQPAMVGAGREAYFAPMSTGEYGELIDFLAGKFDAIDRRFDAIEGRLDAIEARLSAVEVTVEQNRHLIQLNAEAILATRETMDRRFDAVELRLDRLEKAA